MNKQLLVLTICSLAAFGLSAQELSKGVTQDFAGPVITDSASTIMIPTLYDAGIFTSNKMQVGNEFYANVLFYNFKKDSVKRLFAKDTYIANFNRVDHYSYDERRVRKQRTAQLFFYRVMNMDHNRNGKIDHGDPVVLYVSDIYGNRLTQLTASNDNMVSMELYEKQNIALVKVQRDQNKDGEFNYKDGDYYYVKVDLSTLAVGNKIELRPTTDP